MITTKQVDEIIDAVMERIEIGGIHRDEWCPLLSTNDRNQLIGIIKDIVDGK